ncbi:uncharacterized protein LOC109842634, partial [Asparagus officinalis]|uniref:uncharacterized protein LOC109842634 n=1 Tax=Asparagus officinalis TaxID=4686 RepID=UPI00098E5B77
SNGVGRSTSSRFAFTVSHLDSLKIWYLSSVTPTTTAGSSPSLLGVSPLNARSYSFASPRARSTPWPHQKLQGTPLNSIELKDQLFASKTDRKRRDRQPLEQIIFGSWGFLGSGDQKRGPRQQLRTPRLSFLQSPSMLFSGFNNKEGGAAKGEKAKETFMMYLRFHRWPYDEMVYRAKMWPLLGGLMSIMSPHEKQQRFSGGGGNAQLQHHHKI